MIVYFQHMSYRVNDILVLPAHRSVGDVQQSTDGKGMPRKLLQHLSGAAVPQLRLPVAAAAEYLAITTYRYM